MILDFLVFRRHSDDIDGLKKLSLFEGLSRQELGIVAGLLHTREYLAGEVIFDEGEVGQAIYLMLAGQVSICRQGRPEDGHLATLGAGEFFGELGLLDDSVRTAQVRAVSDCKTAVLFREDFQGLMESHLRIAHKIGRQLLRHLGQRLRELSLTVENYRHL